MRIRFYLFILLIISGLISAQQYAIGKVTNTDGVELADVQVTNIYTDKFVMTDSNGNFMIACKIGEEIRFTKPRYERASRKINESSFQAPINVALTPIPKEIEEIELKPAMTGDLRKDSRQFNQPKKVEKMKKELAQYIKRPSTHAVLAPKHGEFVQPVGQGFSVGKVEPQWSDIDLAEFLISTLSEDFFLSEYRLKKTEIQPFIYYVFRSGFPRGKILKYGSCDSKCVADFIDWANKKSWSYKKNIPIEVKKKR